MKSTNRRETIATTLSNKAQQKKARGTNFTEESSINEVWKGVNGILNPRDGNKGITIKTGQRPSACNKCGEKFAREKHKKAHTGEKPFPCKTCDKGFPKIDHYEKAYPCKTCDKGFNQTSLESTDNGEKPYACNTCDRKFDQNEYENTHTGEKPFAYRTCDKTFDLSSLTCRKCGEINTWNCPETTVEDPLEVAEEFNKWFKEKIEMLINKIDKNALEDPFERLK